MLPFGRSAFLLRFLLLDGKVAAQLIERGNLAAFDLLSCIVQAALECRVLLFLRRIKEVLKVFVFGEA